MIEATEKPVVENTETTVPAEVKEDAKGNPSAELSNADLTKVVHHLAGRLGLRAADILLQD